MSKTLSLREELFAIEALDKSKVPALMSNFHHIPRGQVTAREYVEVIRKTAEGKQG